VLTGTELLISFVFVIVLLFLSIIEAAFTSVNKISVRRLLDTPKLKFVPQLATLVESRNEVLMSIHPNSQSPLLTQNLLREERIDCPVPADVVERLRSMPEFIRAYEPDGMSPKDFLTFGATQRTLNQFIEAGWRLLENYQ